jgi:RNA polymerase sigma factor (sigma-70 family)
MKYARNDGSIEENAVRNRFTAYLKTSLTNNVTRYTVKLKNKRMSETSLNETEHIAEDFFEQIFSGEIEDVRLQRALSGLRENERIILMQHVIHDLKLKEIAEAMGTPYATVKSLYRRTLEKLRKELKK